MNLAYVIYIIICGSVGVVCYKADIDRKDWKYWAILFSVIGAYICGTCK